MTGYLGKAVLKQRILLAEDSAADQRIIARALHGAGFIVDAVADGVDAFLAVQGLPYDLVLMDVHMPIMGGLAATGRIRALAGRFRALPILGMGPYVAVGERAEYLAAGMTDIIAKPVDLNVLLAKVRRHAATARGANLTFESRLRLSSHS